MMKHVTRTFLGMRAGRWIPARVRGLTAGSPQVAFKSGHASPEVGLDTSRTVVEVPSGTIAGARSVTSGLEEQLRLAHRKIERLRRANARLKSLATTDGLTGLFNRRHFAEVLEAQYSYARRHGQPLSVMLIDVDSFKQFNDTFGHQSGDKVLVAVATMLRIAARDYDVVARYGGEEFAVLLPAAGTSASWFVGDRLRATIEGHDWSLRPITVSIGVATIHGRIEDCDELLAQADRALYEAKRRDRNCVVHIRDMISRSTNA